MIDEETTIGGCLPKVFRNKSLVRKGLNDTFALGLLNGLTGIFVDGSLWLWNNLKGFAVGVLDKRIKRSAGDGCIDFVVQAIRIMGLRFVLLFSVFHKQRVHGIQFLHSILV